MERQKRALVLINPRAGAREAPQAQTVLENALQHYHWQTTFYYIPKGTNPSDLIPRLHEAAAQGASIVIAAGGDGTVSLVANALLDSGHQATIRLGVFPLGTANSIAKELGIPADWTEAAHLIGSEEDAISLDAMKMNDRHYFLRIGIGLDAEVIRNTTRKSKQWFGRWAYMQTFLGRLFSPHRYRFNCIIDGRRRSFKAVQVFIANGGQIALAPFRIGPNIAFDDGILNICAYDVQSWWQYFVIGWRLLRRDYQQQPQLKFWTVSKSITVRTKKPLSVHGDGEMCATTPVTIEVVPRALQVIAVKPVSL